MDELTHLDKNGRIAMVDVSGKNLSRRFARATGRIRLRPETTAMITAGTVAKGNVVATAELAGIQAAKKTAELIPLCHTLPLENILVRVELDDSGASVAAEARCTGKTGVEMEALVAVSTALLTIYDMCKAVDKTMDITDIRLEKKTKEDV